MGTLAEKQPVAGTYYLRVDDGEFQPYLDRPHILVFYCTREGDEG